MKCYRMLLCAMPICLSSNIASGAEIVMACPGYSGEAILKYDSVKRTLKRRSKGKWGDHCIDFGGEIVGYRGEGENRRAVTILHTETIGGEGGAQCGTVITEPDGTKEISTTYFDFFYPSKTSERELYGVNDKIGVTVETQTVKCRKLD